MSSPTSPTKNDDPTAREDPSPARTNATTSSYTSCHKGARNLDNMNRTQKKGTLINSPRSLLAAKQEGIDIQANLYYKEWKDFLFESRNDKEIAKIKCQHYLARREEMIDVLRQRREYIIEITSEGIDVKQHSPRVLPKSKVSSDPPPREEPTAERVSTPAVRPSSELAGAKPTEKTTDTTKPPAPSDDGSSDDDSDTSSQAERKRKEAEEEAERQRKKNKYRSPEEFLKQEEAVKKEKMMKQVDRMRQVMEKNRQREIQKQEYAEEMQRRYRQQERERHEEREREEIAKYLRERAAKKRDAELAVQRELKEQATLAKQEAVQRDREARAEAVMARERDRKRQMEIRKLEADLEFARKRDEVEARSQQIHDQAKQAVERRKALLQERMQEADEQRRRLQELRDEELEERRKENERRAQDNARKREEANIKFEAKLSNYKERGQKAEEQRQKLREDRERFLLLRQLQEKDKDRQRKETLAQVHANVEKRALDLQKQLAKEERRARRLQEERDHEAKLRLAEKELVIQDRVSAVKRLQLRKEHESIEAAERYEAKMERIRLMREEMKDLERQRLALQASALQEAVKATPTGTHSMSATPGPGEYRVVEAEEKVYGRGPGMKMGGLPAKSRSAIKPAEVPGPGSYSLENTSIAARKRGPKLPPQHRTVDDLADEVTAVKTTTASHHSVRSHTSMSQHTASALPSIQRSSQRRARSPNDGTNAENKNNKHSPSRRTQKQQSKTRRDSTLPDDVEDEDFATDDDFEEVV